MEEFAGGYADTGQVSVLLGAPSSEATGAGRGVTVPVTIMSVVNDSEQRVQLHQGSYVVQSAETTGGTRWKIATASVAEVDGDQLPPAEVADPIVLLRAYFEAIDRRETADQIARTVEPIARPLPPTRPLSATSRCMPTTARRGIALLPLYR